VPYGARFSVRFRRRASLLCALLVAAALETARAGEPTDPVTAASAAYESGVRADQQGLNEAVRGLNGRFKQALERIHVAARDEGELDETLAAKQLWERIVPLATNVVFQPSAPVSGSARCPLPEAPATKGLTWQAYTNYLGKMTTLAGHFNASVSNRHAGFLVALDQLVRVRTREGDLQGAVAVRDQRASVAKAGPIRLDVGGDASAATRGATPAPGVPSAAALHAGDELIPNPSFDTGTRNWSLYQEGGASCTGSRDTNDYLSSPASFQIACRTNGHVDYHIQFYTALTPISISNGATYALTFDAKCSESFAVPGISLQRRGSPWTRYFKQRSALPTITTNWERHRVIFTSNTNATDGRVCFYLGDRLPEGSTLRLDSLSLKAVEGGGGSKDARP
jgi:hypothetical protein